ncbi:Rha family transcriptional regulator [Companilactobacillus futsaii]|uniref:Rha family transcriptional regulator n=1 Tax=Companilactobacillus futsaii TaxID=938155 RepID=UPI00189D7521|nr:phage regulatory protein/antirepressor Ant [Companilactobacillus futsaii]
MNNLVIMKDQQAVTSSLQVAETFNKNHKHVLEAIDNLKEGVAENWADLFYEDTYIHPQNRQPYRVIYMNRDGFTLLAMGFTGKKALKFKLKYIEAFNKMESHIKTGGFKVPSTMAEALRLAADQQEQIETMKPKATYYDLILQNKDLMSVTPIAKDYGMSATKLNQLLAEWGIQYKQGRQWILYAKYQNKGYTQSFTYPSDIDHSHPLTKWTQEGRLFIHEQLHKHGYYATMEKQEMYLEV